MAVTKVAAKADRAPRSQQGAAIVFLGKQKNGIRHEKRCGKRWWRSPGDNQCRAAAQSTWTTKCYTRYPDAYEDECKGTCKGRFAGGSPKVRDCASKSTTVRREVGAMTRGRMTHAIVKQVMRHHFKRSSTTKQQLRAASLFRLSHFTSTC